MRLFKTGSIKTEGDYVQKWLLPPAWQQSLLKVRHLLHLHFPLTRTLQEFFFT